MLYVEFNKKLSIFFMLRDFGGLGVLVSRFFFCGLGGFFVWVCLFSLPSTAVYIK